MLNNFIYSETKGLFLEQLDQKNIPEEAIAFLEDSGEIGNRNHYFGSVGVNNLLTEGKLIGTITANNNPYNIYAPKTYNWSEITSKPTTLAGYGITDAVRVSDVIDSSTMVNAAGYGYNAGGWMGGAGPAFSFGLSHSYKVLLQYPYGPASGLYFKAIYQGEGGEWRRILDSVNYASVLDTRYLQLTGGMLSKNAETLRLHSPEETHGSTFIKFTTSSKDTIQGYMGYSSSGFMFIQRGEGGASGTQVVGLDNNGLFAWKDNAAKYFINEGNYNLYTPSLTGVGASGTWGIDISGSADSFNPHPTSPNNASVNRFFTGGFRVAGTPATNYATGLTLRNRDLGWDFQLSFDSEARLYTRRRTSSDWQDWKTVAFTDSVVAGANKLVATSGAEAAIAENGGVVFPYVTSSLIDGLDSIGVHIKRNMANNPAAMGGLAITNVENKGTILFGGALGLLVYNYVNDAYSVVFRINSSGNVTIGSSDLASTDFKFMVNGDILATSHIRTNELRIGFNQADLDWVRKQLYYTKIGFAAEGKDAGYQNLAMIFSTMYNSSAEGSEVERMRISSNGNVGIGTTAPQAKLHVNGVTTIGTSAPNNALMLDVRGKMRISAGYLDDGYTEFDDRGSRLFYVSEKYGWANGNYAYKTDGTILAAFTMNGSPNSISDFRFRFASDVSFKILPSGVEVPTNKTLKIGDATLSWDSTAQALKINTNVYSDGQVSSGGIEIDPATISTQISQLTATIEGLQSTVKLLQDELNSLK